MKFVIDRKTWRRGGRSKTYNDNYGFTRLLNKQGYMCCLGQIARQCRVPDKDILNWPLPTDVPYTNALYRSLLTIAGENNNLAIDAMQINDDSHISDAKREQLLIELFVAHGHELEFVS